MAAQAASVNARGSNYLPGHRARGSKVTQRATISAHHIVTSAHVHHALWLQASKARLASALASLTAHHYPEPPVKGSP